MRERRQKLGSDGKQNQALYVEMQQEEEGEWNVKEDNYCVKGGAEWMKQEIQGQSGVVKRIDTYREMLQNDRMLSSLGREEPKKTPQVNML